ncbi:hypothetical protein Gotur_022343, partial [Gossypium turneri]
MTILQNLQDEDVEWKAHWIVPDEILYRCNNYRGKIREMSNTWKQIQRMKRITVGATITPEYNGW